MIFFCTIKIHLYGISESCIKEELSMNEAQTIWTKRKLLEMDVYIENKGLLKMTDEDWQNVVAMGDKIVPIVKITRQSETLFLIILKCGRLHGKKRFLILKKELWPKQKEKLYFCTVSFFYKNQYQNFTKISYSFGQN